MNILSEKYFPEYKQSLAIDIKIALQDIARIELAPQSFSCPAEVWPKPTPAYRKSSYIYSWP